jgi:hypothetical protein
MVGLDARGRVGKTITGREEAGCGESSRGARTGETRNLAGALEGRPAAASRVLEGRR